MNKEIEKLQKEIDKLPAGGVTKKKINNTYYFYHQWKDATGKRHYDLVTEAEFADLKAQIEKRRELEKRLKAYQKEILLKAPAPADKGVLSLNLNSNAMLGEQLSAMAEQALEYEKRDCYEILKNYVYGRESDKVCLIYGLRRTGKTTLIRQLLLDMNPEELSKAVYIKATPSDSIASINADLKMLWQKGFKYIFIDEVTLISDFIDSASLFSDVYAAGGMKIVLSGTDSLGFYFAANEELYDRAIMVHTTFIPFREHSRLLRTDSVDEYIRYGGTLKAGELVFEDKDANSFDASFRDNESARRYIDTAICKNIQHSLAYYESGGHFRHLKKLYEADELTNAINRIIQDMNHEFTKDVILRKFVSRDLRSAAQILRSSPDGHMRTDALDNMDISGVIDTLKKILSIREQEDLTESVSQAAATEIREYLKALDLIDYIDIESASADAGMDEKKVIFTQPGMRYCQAEALVYSLLRDNKFKALSEREKLLVTHKILEDVRGIMLEDIVLIETRKALPKSKMVFKLQFDVGEFDMVIYDSKTDSCEIYEVKHSDKSDKNQLKHLLNKEHLELTEKKYGKITGKFVLYNGASGIVLKDCEYKNVSEYLKSL